MTHFNQIANSWDTPEKIKLNEHYSNEIKKFLKNKRLQKILEVGCGTGLLGSNFVDDSSELTGVDTSSGMLEVFKQKFESNKNVKSVFLNLEESELNDSGFDLIISSMAFHHLKNPEAMVLKLKKLLSPDGALAIIDLDQEDGTFHPDPGKMGVFHFGFSKEVTDKWAVNAGFKNTFRKTIHTINKEQKDYPIFLTIFSQN